MAVERGTDAPNISMRADGPSTGSPSVRFGAAARWGCGKKPASEASSLPYPDWRANSNGASLFERGHRGPESTKPITRSLLDGLLRPGFGGRKPRRRPRAARCPLKRGRDSGRLGDERANHPRPRVDLRMPLHPQGPARVRHLDRLDEIVEHAPAGGDDALAERGDGLVMVRLGRVTGLTARARGERARLEAHIV